MRADIYINDNVIHVEAIVRHRGFLHDPGMITDVVYVLYSAGDRSAYK